LQTYGDTSCTTYIIRRACKMYIYYTVYTAAPIALARVRSPSVGFFISSVSSAAAVASSAGGWRRVWYPVRSRVRVRACASYVCTNRAMRIVLCHYYARHWPVACPGKKNKPASERDTRARTTTMFTRRFSASTRTETLRYYKGARVELIYINTHTHTHICVHNIHIIYV